MPLSTALIQELRRLDSCSVSNAIETFNVRLRNEGFTDGTIRCVFDELPPVVGYAVTARIRCSSPPPVGHAYADRTDWWNYILTVPTPRIVAVQDIDGRPGLGAFVGEVHASILRSLGCDGYVTNGGVRDLAGVREAGMQAFAGSVTPSHAFVHIVDFGKPVDIAGLRISSRSLLFGDRHGIVSVPEDLAARIPAAVRDMRAKEHQLIEFCRAPDFSIEQLRSLVEGWQ